jgi:hypothetical protein
LGDASRIYWKARKSWFVGRRAAGRAATKHPTLLPFGACLRCLDRRVRLETDCRHWQDVFTCAGKKNFSFLKKRTKKLLPFGMYCRLAHTRKTKSLLLLFFGKDDLPLKAAF